MPPDLRTPGRPAETAHPGASALRIAFFGTPEFAVPTLSRLLEGRHPVCVVVTQPDRGRGRGRKTSPSPVAQRALDAKVPLLRPENVGDEDCVAALRAEAPDLGVVVAFGQFLPRRVRELPARGYLINAHASLLPRHRGAAPIAHAILAGDEETGISVMRVEREMDAGPVALVRRTAIGGDEDEGSLRARLGDLAAEAIATVLEQIAAGKAVFREQDPAHATLAPRISRDDAHLDFGEDARRVVRRIRAMSPDPGAWTTLEGEPLRILAATCRPDERPDENAGTLPGTVRRDAHGVLRVAAGSGWVVPTRLQRAGGKTLDVDAFLRGRKVEDGVVLGAEGASR